MKFLRVITITIISLIAITFIAYGSTKDNNKPIFMGEVIEVSITDNYGNKRIRVNGFMKNCDIYQDEIYGIVSEETDVVKDWCKIGIINHEFNVEVGDTVYMELSDTMTMSIPPQINVDRILLTKKGK